MKRANNNNCRVRSSLREKWREVRDPQRRFAIAKAIQEAKRRYRQGPVRPSDNRKYRFTCIVNGGNEVTVMCNEWDPFKIVIDKFCHFQGQDKHNVSFWLNGEEIADELEDLTPLELGYEYPMRDMLINVKQKIGTN
ncbi:unnamed protein product [Allacma fusca]|uniref:Uncharacterized protein n=1 Tax=Allacma fusca TaxID=39272 RepID=A0A8J2PAG6_9HEXA|nr:unnamed protein product [Allacma fusca]